jgi:hypothetical protein
MVKVAEKELSRAPTPAFDGFDLRPKVRVPPLSVASGSATGCSRSSTSDLERKLAGHRTRSME